MYKIEAGGIEGWESWDDLRWFHKMKKKDSCNIYSEWTRFVNIKSKMNAVWDNLQKAHFLFVC